MTPTAAATPTAPSGIPSIPTPLPQSGALTQQTQMATADYPPRINVAQLKSLVDSGSVVVIDVRVLEQFQQEHVTGAIHIPFNEITARSGEIPKGKTIVTYCA